MIVTTVQIRPEATDRDASQRVDRYPRIGIESVLATAPDVILQSRMDNTEPGADRVALDYWGGWTSIPAVRDGRVFVFDGTTSLRAGPRIADAVEMLARALHTEVSG